MWLLHKAFTCRYGQLNINQNMWCMNGELMQIIQAMQLLLLKLLHLSLSDIREKICINSIIHLLIIL